MEPSQKRNNRLIIVAVAIFCCGAIIFSLYMARSMVYAELNNLKLIPIPERFTELYFDNASSLPRQTVLHGRVSFSFTIHNLEGAMTTYPYQVYFEYPNGFQVMFASSTTVLADNAFTTITISHTFHASNETGRVIVSLTSFNQDIDFLVPDNN